MAVRNANMLLSNAAAPAAGVQYDMAVQWFGGHLSVSLAGVFDGASFDLVYTTNMPPNGVIPTPTTDWMPDSEWISLGNVTEAGRAYGYINPCMLALRVRTPGSNTRVKAIIG